MRIRLDIAMTIIQGLQRLEYRGYDSAGITLDGTDGEVSVFKEVGPVSNLQTLVKQELADQVRFCGFRSSMVGYYKQGNE